MEKRMAVRILGSGTCVPNPDRYPCSVLVRYRDTAILLDAGPGIMGQVVKTGFDLDEMDAVFLSHFHLDHCADLAPILFAAKYPEFTRKKKLVLAGGPGFKDWFSLLGKAFSNSFDMPGGMVELIELSGTGAFDLKDIQVRHMPMAHRPESTGFRLTDTTGFSLTYSGDTDVTPTLATLAENADIFICESAMPDAMKVPGHLTPGLAGDAAGKAKAQTLVLTHLYPPCDTEDIAGQAKARFGGRVVVARDMMEL